MPQQGHPAGAGYITTALTTGRRSILQFFRTPQLLMMGTIQGPLFLLMFRYVFGGAIPVNVPGGYVSFLMPGIIGQTAAFGSFGTAIALEPFGDRAGIASALLGFLQLGCAAIGTALVGAIPLGAAAAYGVITAAGTTLAVLTFLPVVRRRR